MKGKLISFKSFYDVGHHNSLLNRSTIRAIQGVVVSIGAPSVWLGVRLLSGRNLNAELSNNIAVYLYMLFGACFVFALFGWHVGSQEERLKSQALHDDLTGLYNARFFTERLSEEIVALKRRGTLLALILIDLDHFKSINDEYGHVFGNKVLRKFGGTLKTICRASETMYRIGGDEFCIIMPSCGWEEAHAAASRLLAHIHTLTIRSNQSKSVRLTVSLGIAVTSKDEQLNVKDLLRRADKAIYKAKAKGRDRIEPVDFEIRARRSRLVY